MLNANFIASEFEKLHAALQADGYRVTIQYSPKDPSLKLRAGHGLARVLDPWSKDYKVPPVRPDAIISAIPALIAFSERDHTWHGIPVRANVFLTPLSRDRHHPIVDDVWSIDKCDAEDTEESRIKRKKLLQFNNLVEQGLKYAAQIESSPGNYQYVFNIHRRPEMFLNDVFVDDTITDEAANKSMAFLNSVAGDSGVTKVQQAFRFPGFINRKAKYIDAGIIHQAHLIHAEHCFSIHIEQDIEMVSIEIDEEKRNRINVDAGTASATGKLYAAHQADILKHNPDAHFKDYDIMIAARLFVTGHSTESIADAIYAGTPRKKGGELSYARQTANNAGNRVTPDMLAKKTVWRIIESGDDFYQNNDPGIPELLKYHAKIEERKGAKGDSIQIAAYAMFCVGHSRQCIERSIEQAYPSQDACTIAKDACDFQHPQWQAIARKCLPRWEQAERDFEKEQIAARPRPKPAPRPTAISVPKP